MTDVWKSNARKFCTLCKVWFADNLVSIQHHEGGQKHKEAVKTKLRAVGNESKLKEKEQASLKATLKLMEDAAQKKIEADINANLSYNRIGPLPKPRTYMDPKADSNSVFLVAKRMVQQCREAFRNEKASLESWHKSVRKDSACNNQCLSNLLVPQSEQLEEQKNGEVFWAEAKTNDGVPYYFHMYSGESVWEAPSKYYSYEEYSSKFVASISANSVDEEKCVQLQQASGDSTGAGAINSHQISISQCGESKVKKEGAADGEPSKADSDCTGSTIEDILDIPLPPPKMEKEGTKTEGGVENRDSFKCDFTHSELALSSAIGNNVNPIEVEFTVTASVKQEAFESAYTERSESVTIDYELPPEAKVSKAINASRIEADNEICAKLFGEKIATLHKRKGKEINVEFKKRKVMSQSLRQRAS